MNWIDKLEQKQNRSHRKLKHRIANLETETKDLKLQVANLETETKDLKLQVQECTEMKQRLQERQLAFDFLETLGLFVSDCKDKDAFYDKFLTYPSSLKASKLFNLFSNDDDAKSRIQTAMSLFNSCNWHTLHDVDKIIDGIKSGAFYDAHPNYHESLNLSNPHITSLLMCIQKLTHKKKRKRNE